MVDKALNKQRIDNIKSITNLTSMKRMILDDIAEENDEEDIIVIKRTTSL